jgi:hypothetical protein
VCLARVVDSLRTKGRTIPNHLLKHVLPIAWEHINLTGIYSWQTEPTDPTVFRSLREANPGKRLPPSHAIEDRLSRRAEMETGPNS